MDRTYRKCVHILAFCAVVLQSPLPISRADDRPEPLHWGLVSSTTLRDAGVSDLLTVRLASRDDLVLVEREDVGLVFDEQTVSALLGDQGIAERLKAGALLGAERLLVLRSVEGQGNGRIEVGIIDTQAAARLYVASLDLKAASPYEIATSVLELVGPLLDRFSRRTKAVIGIPWFTAKGLASEQPHFQRDWPVLLEVSLRELPGVAVLALDEARLIHEELNRSGSRIQRVVPLFVSGEYQLAAESTLNDPRFAIDIRISDGETPLDTLQRESLTKDEVTLFLRDDVFPRIAGRLGNDAQVPLGLDRQKADLAARANHLSQYGAHLPAMDLRSAVLVIDPDDVETRVRYVVDYISASRTPSAAIALPHLEFLIRNRLIGIREAVFLLKAFDLPNRDDTFLWCSERERSKWQMLERRPDWCKNRVTQVCHLGPMLMRLGVANCEIPYLVDMAKGKLDPHDRWYWQSRYRTGAKWVASRFMPVYEQVVGGSFSLRGEPNDPEYLLAALRRLLDDLPPEHVGAVAQNMTRTSGFAHGDFSAKRIDNFVAGMVRFHEAVIEHLKTYDREDLGAAIKAQREAIFDVKFIPRTNRREIVRPYQSAPRPKPPSPQKEMQQSKASQLAGRAGSSPKKPTDVSKLAPKQNEQSNDAPGIAPDVTIEELPRSASDRRLLRHGSVDIVWSARSINLLEKMGTAHYRRREIYSAGIDTGTVLCVESDGRHLWVGDVKRGVVLLASDGAELACSDAESGLPPFTLMEGGQGNPYPRMLPHHEVPDGIMLPPITHGYPYLEDSFPALGYKWVLTDRKCIGAYLTLHPVGEGRCLAFGRYGKTTRTWGALLSYDASNGQINVQLILDAGRRLPARAYDDHARISSAEQIDLAFGIPWICQYCPPEGEACDITIVGRFHDAAFDNHILPNAPLAIDLETLRVSTLAERLPHLADVTGGLVAQSLNGSLVLYTIGSLQAFVYQGPDLPARKIQVDEWRRTVTAYNRFLIPFRGSIYSPGNQWLQIDLVDHPGKVTFLSSQKQPSSLSLLGIAPSANFGFWATNRGRAYRIDLTGSHEEASASAGEHLRDR